MNNTDTNYITAECFGQLPSERFDAEYLRLIKLDIADAQRQLEDLPADQRRGLTLETLRHFKCGYLPDWILTKSRAEFTCGLYVNKETGEAKHLPPPSRRIIIPTADGEHFNAVALPAERQRMDKKFWKQHAGEKQIFGDMDSVINADIVLAVEGELDDMSIWQATSGQVAVVAILGCRNWKKTLPPILSTLLAGKKLLLLLDGDESGRVESDNLREELIRRGVPAVSRYLIDEISLAEGKAKFGVKVDCNDVLIKCGDKFLASLIERIIADARADLSAAENRIRQQSLFERAGNSEDNAQPENSLAVDNEKSAPKQSDSETKTAPAVTPEITATARDALKTIPVAKCSEGEWTEIIWAGIASGLPTEELREWSRHDSRYDSSTFQDRINRYDPKRTGKNGEPLTVATLIKIAKGYGYEPPSPAEKATRILETLPADVRERITAWQEINGAIEPATLEKICAAKKFFDELTPEKITAKFVNDWQLCYKLAISQFYGFENVTEEFFDILKDAQVKSALPASDDVKSLANVRVSEVRKKVAEFVTKVKREHSQYQKQIRRDEARQKAEQLQAKRNAFMSNTLIKLNGLRKAPQSDERDAEIISRINAACEWKVDKFKNPVAVMNTTANAKLIFTYDPVLDGAFGFDEFQQADVILKPLPWYKNAQCVGETFKDRDAAEIRFYLSETYREFGSVQRIDDAITKFSNQRAFHPVKEYFNNLPKWDGKPRAETLFIDFLGAADTPFHREATLNWLIAAVARIYYPGCRYQLALILHGQQGIGKSYILERLGGRWYGAISDNVDDSHAIDAIQNIWIGEFKEMKGLRKADVNAIKAFIDTAADNRRAAFERRAAKVNRHVVFGITVNDDQFLSDVTGNRRFPIVECGNKPGEYREGLTDEYISQVWAEVKFKFKELMTDESGNYHFDEKKLELSRAAKQRVEEIANRHMRDDGLATEIQGYLDTKILPQVIWKLLTREQRRKFIVDGYIAVAKGELEAKRHAGGGRKSDITNDINEIKKHLERTDVVLQDIFKRSQLEPPETRYKLFGCEHRQHICAAEINAECFGADKRKNMPRINEVLSQLDGWTAGERLQNADPKYPDQKKPYFRNETLDDKETSPDETQIEILPKDDFDDAARDALEDLPF